MKLKNVKRSAMVFALSASFILPHAPQTVWAAKEGTPSFPLDLFPEDSGSDTGLFPTTPAPTPGKSNGSAPKTNVGAVTTRPQAGTSKASMNAARVPEAYTCPLFDNRPHAELIAAIDSLNKEVKASPECAGT
ncbi:MAG: hypothetical protein KUL82_09670, partial [Bdellovibrio sp.]|nr:hypothetical protein [Bdellovibrio sp.]